MGIVFLLFCGAFGSFNEFIKEIRQADFRVIGE